jgi:molybdopterin converting factor subunit 1
MNVRVLFFATAREAAGCAAVELSLTEGATVGEARGAIARRFPELEPRLLHFRYAVDREFAGEDAVLHEGAELAVIPPVSGG